MYGRSISGGFFPGNARGKDLGLVMCLFFLIRVSSILRPRNRMLEWHVLLFCLFSSRIFKKNAIKPFIEGQDIIYTV